MQLTRSVGYGLEGILYLAAQGKDEPAFVREISRATAIPETFLAKILQRLASKGLIRSRRGFRGGFLLARPAGNITLREIVEALEGPIVFDRSLDRLRARGQRKGSRARRIFDQVQRRVSLILEQTTLADILETTETETTETTS
jgi:Rrf2 family protein